MTLISFGLIYAVSMLIVAAVAYDEGKKHAQEDTGAAEARGYNTGHSEGFDDGWNASESVHRAIQNMGHGARW